MGAAEFGLDEGPVAAELEEHSAATGGIDKGAAGGGLEPGGTTSDGECEAALDGVEVRSVGEGELELVSKWRADGPCSLKRLSAARWALESRAV